MCHSANYQQIPSQWRLKLCMQPTRVTSTNAIRQRGQLLAILGQSSWLEVAFLMRKEIMSCNHPQWWRLRYVCRDRAQRLFWQAELQRWHYNNGNIYINESHVLESAPSKCFCFSFSIQCWNQIHQQNTYKYKSVHQCCPTLTNKDSKRWTC